MKGIVQILIALVVAIAVFFAFVKFTQKDDAGNKIVRVKGDTKVIVKEVPVSEIIVAKRYIPIGTVMSGKDFDVQPWPSHLKLPGFIEIGKKEDEQKVGLESITGMVTRTPFQKGEPIIMNKLSNPDDPSFLASGLGKGMRAVTISVNNISSVSGFIMPGDRVDVLVTHEVPVDLAEEEGASYNRRDAEQTVSEALLSNVKILAVDQRATSEAQEKPKVPSNVTLEVTKIDAQRVLLAAREGRMSLVLRPLDDGDLEIARPSGVADLSRVTPPSYFPVLYDNSSTYTPEIVDIFGDFDPANLSVSQKALFMRSGGKISGSGSATNLSSGSKDSVIVIRGVRRETVGVNRP